MPRSVRKPLDEPQKPPSLEEEIQPHCSDEEILEFTKAIDEYRRKQNRPFPTWSEVLQILHSLGYRKV